MTRALARAPVRVDPAGGGTDAPPFSIEHGGTVVNFAIERHAFASVDRLPAGAGVIIYSHDLHAGIVADSVGNLAGDRLEFLRGFIRQLVPPQDSILLATESDVPPGAGLGGSGALGVAVVAALDRAYGRTRSAEQTAILANEIERIDLGYPGGDQDSWGAALGGINRLDHRRDGTTVASRIDITDDVRLSLEHTSLLIYTSEAHVSGNIHRDIRESYARDNSPTVDAMMKLRESARRLAASLESGDLAGHARELNESCRNLYRLHPSCDSEAHRRCFAELDDLILGGKTCGAGGGGFLLVATRPGRRRECISRAEAMGDVVWPVTIDFAGVRSWSGEPTSAEDVERYRELAAG